jgi:hypothetical protein
MEWFMMHLPGNYVRATLLGLLAAGLILASAPATRAQLTEEELARRPFWETFLAKAKIVQAEDIGEGVTRPKRLELRRDDVTAFGVWKRPSAAGSGRFDRWEHEVAAYRMDKLLGLGMVPPVVRRSYHGYPGSLQLWQDLEYSELQMEKENIQVPPEKREAYDRARSLQMAFDSLVANADRSLQNLRYTRDWRLILIDHSQSFRDLPPYTGSLIYPVGDTAARPGITRLPRAFVDRLRALTYDRVRSAVEDYLTSSEIRELLVRRDLLLQRLADLVREKGEDRVLY